MEFFLGTAMAHWLASANVPLFISQRTLARVRRALPRAVAPWALDSGGFTELSLRGRWQTTARDYAAAVQRYAREIGMLRWASIQDWMCEPFMLDKTGLNIAEHQRRTVESWLELRSLAPDVTWLPVLQGWTMGHYLDHVELYDKADRSWRDGTVGLGSVCRRQGEIRISTFVTMLAAEGIKLHGFGVKMRGLDFVADKLASADSMAWSFDARRGSPMSGCTHSKCANCIQYALAWREQLLSRMEKTHGQTVS